MANFEMNLEGFDSFEEEKESFSDNKSIISTSTFNESIEVVHVTLDKIKVPLGILKLTRETDTHIFYVVTQAHHLPNGTVNDGDKVVHNKSDHKNMTNIKDTDIEAQQVYMPDPNYTNFPLSYTHTISSCYKFYKDGAECFIHGKAGHLNEVDRKKSLKFMNDLKINIIKGDWKIKINKTANQQSREYLNKYFQLEVKVKNKFQYNSTSDPSNFMFLVSMRVEGDEDNHKIPTNQPVERDLESFKILCDELKFKFPFIILSNPPNHKNLNVIKARLNIWLTFITDHKVLRTSYALTKFIFYKDLDAYKKDSIMHVKADKISGKEMFQEIFVDTKSKEIIQEQDQEGNKKVSKPEESVADSDFHDIYTRLEKLRRTIYNLGLYKKAIESIAKDVRNILDSENRILHDLDNMSKTFGQLSEAVIIPPSLNQPQKNENSKEMYKMLGLQIDLSLKKESDKISQMMYTFFRMELFKELLTEVLKMFVLVNDLSKKNFEVKGCDEFETKIIQIPNEDPNSDEKFEQFTYDQKKQTYLRMANVIVIYETEINHFINMLNYRLRKYFKVHFKRIKNNLQSEADSLEIMDLLLSGKIGNQQELDAHIFKDMNVDQRNNVSRRLSVVPDIVLN